MIGTTPARRNHPLVSIEDPLNEDDWEGWRRSPSASVVTGPARRRRPVRHQPEHLARHREGTANARCSSRSTRSARSPRRSTLSRHGPPRRIPCMMSHRSRDRRQRSSPTSRSAQDHQARSRPAPRHGPSASPNTINSCAREEEPGRRGQRSAGAGAFPASPPRLHPRRAHCRRRPPATSPRGGLAVSASLPVVCPCAGLAEETGASPSLARCSASWPSLPSRCCPGPSWVRR